MGDVRLGMDGVWGEMLWGCVGWNFWRKLAGGNWRGDDGGRS